MGENTVSGCGQHRRGCYKCACWQTGYKQGGVMINSAVYQWRTLVRISDTSEKHRRQMGAS